ncbi:MAG: hypothetical protein IPH51_12800 [Rubrivivax sp.]|nr:hypothetical protein [Rubrivivax sp.]
MNLSGPLALTVSGLPSPDPMAAPAKGPFTPSVELQATLEGSIEGSPHPVKLIVDGTADRQRVEVRELRAEAGAAQAALTLSAQRAAGQPCSRAAAAGSVISTPWRGGRAVKARPGETARTACRATDAGPDAAACAARCRRGRWHRPLGGAAI